MRVSGPRRDATRAPARFVVVREVAPERGVERDDAEQRERGRELRDPPYDRYSEL